MRFPVRERLKFVAVLRGTAWVVLPDTQPCLLQAGDTFLLTNTPYVVTSDPSLEPLDGVALFGEKGILRYGGNETVMLGGAFAFVDRKAHLIVGALPGFMKIPASQPAAAILRQTLALLDRELEQAQMGSSVMMARLGDILLIQALRAYVAEYGATATGWLGALSDPRIGAAITLMHSRVDHDWTVCALAHAVAMSRSAFALRFKSMTGAAPLEYLRRWRMQLAQHALRQGLCSVAVIAASVGYASVSAFGSAYKRTYGSSPKRDLVATTCQSPSTGLSGRG
jgi:AraC-like DNA-binding protein